MENETMKRIKTAVIAASLLGALGASLPASAQFAGEYDSDNWSRYYSQVVRPMVTKMPSADVKKVMEMEMAVAKMESEHRATMMKMDSEHKMAVLKMRQQLEDYIYTRSAK
jgi:hypothetical protein